MRLLLLLLLLSALSATMDSTIFKGLMASGTHAFGAKVAHRLETSGAFLIIALLERRAGVNNVLWIRKSQTKEQAR